ncbi:MAG TPA: HAD hydrolase-like protein [Vitreimonas sp.]|nr:HAD hydrolase-like protein [Vitreimonas sp.]
MSLLEHLKAQPKKYLIFDFDETIAKLHLPWGIFIERQLEILKKFDPELVNMKTKEMNVMSLVNIFVEKFGEIVHEPSMEWAEEFEREYDEGYTVNPELIEFIRTASQAYTCFVWSSNCTDTINRVLRKEDLAQYFQAVISKNMVQFVKPVPDGFELIFEEVADEVGANKDISLEDFLMIGDSSADAGAAQAAGIDFYKVEYFKR